MLDQLRWSGMHSSYSYCFEHAHDELYRLCSYFSKHDSVVLMILWNFFGVSNSRKKVIPVAVRKEE